jgi:hypothetical protein
MLLLTWIPELLINLNFQAQSIIACWRYKPLEESSGRRLQKVVKVFSCHWMLMKS